MSVLKTARAERQIVPALNEAGASGHAGRIVRVGKSPSRGPSGGENPSPVTTLARKPQHARHLRVRVPYVGGKTLAVARCGLYLAQQVRGRLTDSFAEVTCGNCRRFAREHRAGRKK